jgi:hypothetical protein
MPRDTLNSNDYERHRLKSIRYVLRNLQGPYDPFDAYYPLTQVIEQYGHIWYESDSSNHSSDSQPCCGQEDCSEIIKKLYCPVRNQQDEASSSNFL